MLKRFIAAFGKKYDGDPRIGYITAGLLGHWGEWHTYPREELFAGKEVQTEVMDAYRGGVPGHSSLCCGIRAGRTMAFGPPNATPAVRLPRRFVRLGHARYRPERRRVVLHDGAQGGWTEGGRQMEVAANWRRDSSGGLGQGIRRAAWLKGDSGLPPVRGRDARELAVGQRHVPRNQPSERRKRAEDEVRRMGYEFHVRRGHDR